MLEGHASCPTSALHLAQTLLLASSTVTAPVSLFPWPCPHSSRPARMTMSSATLLTICTLSALLLVARGLEKPSAAPVVAVGVVAASDLIRSGGHRYLDVRTEEEFSNGHVEDSLNVPYLFFTSQGWEKNTKFIAQVAADFNKQDNIVVGCKSGVRSELACADLMAAGFKNVKNIEGGYTAWVENGLAVKKSQAQDEL